MKVLVSFMMSVGLLNKEKRLKLRHYDISRPHIQRTAQRLIYIRLPAEDRQKYGEDKVGRLIKSMHGTQDASQIWQFDPVNLLGGFRRGNHSAALFHNPNQVENVSARRRLCVCQAMMGSNTSTVFSNQNTQRWEHLDSKIQT